MDVTVHGEVASGWGGVAGVLRHGLDRGDDLGAAAELPAAHCITNARAVATVHAATLGPVGGHQLLGDAVLDRARATVTPDREPDLSLTMPTTFGFRAQRLIDAAVAAADAA